MDLGKKIRAVAAAAGMTAAGVVLSPGAALAHETPQTASDCVAAASVGGSLDGDSLVGCVRGLVGVPTATNTAFGGSVSATGDDAVAVNTGVLGTATAIGDSAFAANTAILGTATAVGDDSVAINTGILGKAIAS